MKSLILLGPDSAPRVCFTSKLELQQVQGPLSCHVRQQDLSREVQGPTVRISPAVHYQLLILYPYQKKKEGHWPIVNPHISIKTPTTFFSFILPRPLTSHRRRNWNNRKQPAKPFQVSSKLCPHPSLISLINIHFDVPSDILMSQSSLYCFVFIPILILLIVVSCISGRLRFNFHNSFIQFTFSMWLCTRFHGFSIKRFSVEITSQIYLFITFIT